MSLNKRIGLLIGLAILLLPLAGTAQVLPRLNVVITAIAPSPVAAACATTGYAATCFSGSCTCLSIQNAKLGGNFRGTASLFITEDPNSPTVTQLTSNCIPFFGTMAFTGVTGAAVPTTAALNILGANCSPLTAIGPTTLQGAGFGITAPTDTAGYGTLTGTITQAGLMRLTLKGPLAEVATLTGPSPTPTSSSTATASPTATATVTPTASPSITVVPTPTPSPTPTPTLTPTPTPLPMVTDSTGAAIGPVVTIPQEFNSEFPDDTYVGIDIGDGVNVALPVTPDGFVQTNTPTFYYVDELCKTTQLVDLGGPGTFQSNGLQYEVADNNVFTNEGPFVVGTRCAAIC